MANNYLSNPNNPFFSLEDDVDDETFLRGVAPRYPSSSDYRSPQNHYSSYDSELERKHQELLERKKEIEERTIQSSERSVAKLRETEDIGLTTAEELLRQREQLERTERRLEDINSTLRFSQKHIQSIKSVFGGLKNYFSSKPLDQQPHVSSSSSSQYPGAESPTASSSSNNFLQRLNSIDKPSTSQVQDGQQQFQYHIDQEKNYTAAKNIAAVLEQNLDEMSGSISRLKDLAIGLSEEIDTQNDIIDSITDKAEKADITVQRQNKDIRHLLRK